MSMRLFFTFCLLRACLTVSAQQDTIQKPGNRFNLHFQTTYIYQYSAHFHALYSGSNSLSADEERQNSLTMTLFGGVKLWNGAEFYVNPEIAGGSGLSGALGMAGSSNGETFRAGNPSPTLYLARAFFTQTIGIVGKGIFAFIANGLSEDHQEYLIWGGKGFILGDGALNYGPETIGEIYYSARLRKEGLWLSADYQLCMNPGYNKDRGPASIASIRVHLKL